jgi:hypothetical protein
VSSLLGAIHIKNIRTYMKLVFPVSISGALSLFSSRKKRNNVE